MMRGDGKKRVTRRERFLGEMDVAARSKLAKREPSCLCCLANAPPSGLI